MMSLLKEKTINGDRVQHPPKRNDYLLISLLTLLSFVALFVFRSIDDNRLTSWEWVFRRADVTMIYALLILGIGAAFLLSKTTLPERYPAVFLFFISFLAALPFWGEPEVIVDASRYFTQAKHLEEYGIGYFFREWGKNIFAWTDMPLVSFLYGLIFKVFGESRHFIQAFTTLLFSSAVVLTYGVGRSLWNEDVGFAAGLLLLGMPYLLTQVPLMLVDVPTMFFLLLSIFLTIKALEKGGAGIIASSSAAVFFAFYSKYSTWMMLSVLVVVFLVYLKADHPGRRAVIHRGVAIAAVSAVLIGFIFLSKLDVFSEQIRLLMSYQKPGLKRWGESFASTFFFQIHPFITLSALYSFYLAFKKRDLKYAIISWLVILLLFFQIKRIRYTVPLFPMVALMASYGLARIKRKEIRRFVVCCVLFSSLTLSLFAYLPFTRQMSAVNLKKAGEFLDGIDEKTIEVYVLPQRESDVNPAVAVPILDLHTGKRITYRHDPSFFPPGEGTEASSLRFTWEYKNPEYYEKMRAEGSRAVVVISDREGDGPAEDSENRMSGFRLIKTFSASEGIFQFQTFVSVYRAAEGDRKMH